MEYFVLSNGEKIPKIGLGTDTPLYGVKLKKPNSYILRKLYAGYIKFIKYPYYNHKLVNAVSEALKMGYRLIDTSASYSNEKLISRGIKKSGVPREDIFIITRATNKMQREHSVREGFFQSLSNLGIDYIDLYMIHWPVTGAYVEAWKEIISLQKEGYIKNIGVANCHIRHIKELVDKTGCPPIVDEVEIQPLFNNRQLVEDCKSMGVQMIAYTPLARQDERYVQLPKMRAIAAKYNKTIPQIILRWHIQNGVIPIPRSTNKNRLKNNISVFDFELSTEDMATIDSFNINARLRYDPDNCDFSIL